MVTMTMINLIKQIKSKDIEETQFNVKLNINKIYNKNSSAEI